MQTTPGFSNSPACPGENNRVQASVFDNFGFIIIYTGCSSFVGGVQEHHNCENSITIDIKHNSTHAIITASHPVSAKVRGLSPEMLKSA
ncbi:hypothetical protein TNCT_372081 [Trichonephila clavata]|uniref:Uncharacterized protein n=1 Tax=Trichonephila clavata TaxID=2740835 RepID=A0A8X6HLJ3_TRICU|nr:hypothetical protein TNCT_372081 [Trichonephila clavata]